MSDHKDAPPATTAKAQRAEPSLVELIAQTPGAQTREQALKHIASREKEFTPRKAQRRLLSDDDVDKREPLPIIDNPQNAANFWKRFNAREEEKRKPPKGSKPRLLIDNDKPDPSDKN